MRHPRTRSLMAVATQFHSAVDPLPPPTAARPTVSDWLWRGALLAAAYFLVAKLGLRYATIGPSISPVWPPTGLAIAALAVLGMRYWPAVLVGAFAANATTNIPMLAALGIACGNAGEALLAAYLLRRRAGAHVALDDLPSITALAVWAAPLGALASAITGVTSLWLAHVIPGSGFSSALALWWWGNYLGAVVVCPALLTWRDVHRSPLARRQVLELLLFVSGAVLAATLVFGNLVPSSFLEPTQYPSLLFPFVIGAALRFGPRGASILTLTVASLAVAYTAQGGGPFIMHSIPSTAVALMLYIGVLAIASLSLSPAVARRLKAEGALREAHGHLQAVIDSSPLAIYTVDAARQHRARQRQRQGVPRSRVQRRDAARDRAHRNQEGRNAGHRQSCRRALARWPRTRHRDVVDRRGPHRDAAARGPVPSGTEDGGRRPAGGRHRTRFQQPAHRDHRNHRAAAGGCGYRFPDAPRRSGDRKGGQAGRRPDAAAARVQPSTGARTPRARYQRGDTGPRADVRQAHWRGRQLANAARGGSGNRPRGPGAAPAGDRESGRQRAGRDADGGPGDDRNGGRRARSAAARDALADTGGAPRDDCRP